MARVSKQVWLEKGIEVLGKEGFKEIRIDRLCKHLKVSKGSFYHHFKNSADYVKLLMAFWEEQVTEATIAYAEKGKTSEERMQRLQYKVFQNPVRLEVQIRAWASIDEVVNNSISRIDENREFYMYKQYKDQGFSEKSSRLFASLENTYYIGIITKMSNQPKAELMKNFALFEKLLIDWIKPNLS